MYRNYNAIQFEVRRRLANGFAWAANYTGSVTKQYTGLRLVPDGRGQREPELAQERQPAAQREVHLQLDDPGGEPLPRQQRHRQGRPRRLAVVGDHDLAGRHLVELHATTSPGAPNATTSDRRPRRIARDHRVRPEPAAQRADVRAAVPHRVRPAARAAAPMPADTLYQGTGVGAGQEDARMGLGYINHDLTLLKNFSSATDATCRSARRSTTCSTPRSTRA